MEREEIVREIIQTKLDIRGLIDVIEEVRIYSVGGRELQDKVLDILYDGLEEEYELYSNIRRYER